MAVLGTGRQTLSVVTRPHTDLMRLRDVGCLSLREALTNIEGTRSYEMLDKCFSQATVRSSRCSDTRATRRAG